MSANMPLPEHLLSRFERNQINAKPWLYPETRSHEWLVQGYPRRLGVLPHVGLLTITSTTGGTITSAATDKVAVINRISMVVPDGISALDLDIYAGTGASGGSAYLLAQTMDDISDCAAYANNVQKITSHNADDAVVWNALQGTPAVDKMFKFDWYFRQPVILRSSAGLQNKIQVGGFTSSTSANTTLGAYTAGDAEDVSFAAVGWECNETSFNEAWRDQQNWYTRMFRLRGTQLYANETAGVATTTDDNIVDPSANYAYFIDGFRYVCNDALTPVATSITYGTSPTDFTGYDIDNQQELIALADRVWAWKDGGDGYYACEVRWPPVLVNGNGGIYSSLSSTAAENVVGIVEDTAVTAGEGWITFDGWKVATADLLEDL